MMGFPLSLDMFHLKAEILVEKLGAYDLFYNRIMLIPNPSSQKNILK